MIRAPMTRLLPSNMFFFSHCTSGTLWLCWYFTNHEEWKWATHSRMMIISLTTRLLSFNICLFSSCTWGTLWLFWYYMTPRGMEDDVFSDSLRCVHTHMYSLGDTVDPFFGRPFFLGWCVYSVSLVSPITVSSVPSSSRGHSTPVSQSV